MNTTSQIYHYISTSEEESKQPEGNPNMWRYMDFPSFMSLILDSSLLFKSLDKFEDASEGTLEDLMPFADSKHKEKSSKKGDNESNDLFIEQKKILQANRKCILVNSWSLDQKENYALWKIFLNGSKEGTAIKSNYDRLLKSLVENPDSEKDLNLSFYGSAVYYELEKMHSNNPLDNTVIDIAGIKKPFYIYENEYRLIMLANKENKYGSASPIYPSGVKMVEVNLDRLIDKIYISPFADKWFVDLVRKVVKEKLTF